MATPCARFARGPSAVPLVVLLSVAVAMSAVRAHEAFGDLSEVAAGAAATGEKHEFQAEVHNLMGILVNSLYTEKEIFLRELISNASDALDKIRFAALTDPSQLDSAPELKIWISYDAEAGYIHVSDTGIGMTHETLLSSLGTIAQSGTKDFVNQVSATGDLNLIGQFGVGFYSVYLVAEEVTVTTKNNDDVQYIWHSTADSSFTLVEDPRGNTLGRGTTVSLKLMEGVRREFLNQHRLQTIIDRYSAFIDFPIYLRLQSLLAVDLVTDDTEFAIEEEEARYYAEIVGLDDDDDDADEYGDGDEDESFDGFVDEDEDDADDASSTKGKDKDKDELSHVTVWDWEQANDVKPLWTRTPDEVTEEDYTEFFYAIKKVRGWLSP